MNEDADDSRSSQPLRGVVLCCTSIPVDERTELATRAEQMGAVYKLDLTSDVTHLIVGDPTTAKYRYVARERPDVVVIQAEWIEEVRKLWIQGDEFDASQLEERYRRPVFADLRISLTGFDDLDQRQRLQELIIQNGAEYHGQLVRQVTHVVAKKPEGEKYKHAKLWGLKVVSLEWLTDSIERGMALDESLYDPVLPKEERGKNAWVRREAPAVTLGKRSRQDPEPASAADAGRKKLRRTASVKLQSQNSGLWGDIIGGDADQRLSGRASCGEGAQFQKPPQPTSGRGSATQLTQDHDDQGMNEGGPSRVEIATDVHNVSNLKSQGVFSDLVFYLHGFDERKSLILQCHLLSQKGAVATSLHDLRAKTQASQQLRAFVLVPHDSQEGQSLELAEFGQRPAVVSEWWIERCLHCKRVTDPGIDVCSRPFNHFPIPGFDQLTVSSTGFGGVDLLHLAKAVKLMGAKYDEFLTPNASVLICAEHVKKGEKLNHALGWNVPIVTAQWLWDSIQKAETVPFDGYLKPVSRSAGQSSNHIHGTSTDDGPLQAQRLGDDDEFGAAVRDLKRRRLPKESILKGCHVYISRRLQDQAAELQETATSLGANISSYLGNSFTPVITHYIDKPNKKRNDSKEYIVAARIRSCRIVSPEWLHRCVETGIRADETDFLLDYDVRDLARRMPPPKLDLVASGRRQPLHNSTKETPVELRSEDKTPKPPPKTGSKEDAPKEEEQDKTPEQAPADDSTGKATSTVAGDLNSAIIALLARKRLASISQNITSGTDRPLTSAVGDGRKPPPRLGKATSNLLAQASTATVLKLARAATAPDSADDNDENAGNDEDASPFGEIGSAAAGLGSAGSGQVSSQQVLYEDPEVQAQRERVLRKMGATIIDRPGPERAKSTSIARDAGGIGTRTRQKRNMS